MTKTLILSFALIGLLNASPASSQESDAEGIFLRQWRNFDRLKSIDVREESVRTWIFPKDIPKERIEACPSEHLRLLMSAGGGIETTRARFAAEGTKYFVQFSRASSVSGASNSEAVYAFDGEKNQRLLGDSGRLDVTTNAGTFEDQYVRTPAFLLPYAYISNYQPGGQATVKRLTNWDNWAEAAKTAQVLGETDLDGRRVVVVEVHVPRPGSQQKTTYRAYCAPDLDYYPVQYERLEDGLRSVRFKVGDVTAVGITDGESVYINGSSFYEHWSPEPPNNLVITTETKTDKSTLRVNQDIEDNMFKIPLSYATVLWDVDQKTAMRLKPSPHQAGAEVLRNLKDDTLDTSPPSGTPVGIANEADSHVRIVPDKREESSRLYLVAVLCLIPVAGALAYLWLRRTSSSG